MKGIKRLSTVFLSSLTKYLHEKTSKYASYSFTCQTDALLLCVRKEWVVDDYIIVEEKNYRTEQKEKKYIAICCI